MSTATTEQIIVVGAGPAGLAATKALVEAGAHVLLIDGDERPGGQYWRHSADSALPIKHGELRVITHPNVEYLPSTNVWSATYRDGVSNLNLLIGRKQEREVNTRVLILATGAYDRSLPFPGWDLPGVMTAGGVQALLKSQERLVGREIVVAGTGPFLLPVAVGLIMAGVEVKAIVEASRPTAWFTKLGALTRNGGKFGDFVKFQKIIAGAKVKVHYGSAIIATHGNERVERVTLAKIDRRFRIKAGSESQIVCDALAVGWGFTPDLSVASALGCATRIEPRDGSLIVDVDERQATSLPGVYAAGEITGIGGSALALTEGQIAASSVADSLGLIDPTKAASLYERRRKQQVFANALLEIYRIKDGWITWQKEETVLCRCEEVSVGDVRKAIAELGVSDLRSAKSLTRTGMGMCQGRVCGRIVADFVAKECGRVVTAGDLQGGVKRPVITPIPLGLLANGIDG